MIDIERLDKALNWIETHPEQHDQGVWVRGTTDEGKVDCGTAMCLAGWVVAQEHPGAVFVRDAMDIGSTSSQVRTGPEGTDAEAVEYVAKKLLGATRHQAMALFEASNTLDDLRAMREILAGDPHATYYDLESVYHDDDETDWDGE